jgi:hypothetical protein
MGDGTGYSKKIIIHLKTLHGDHSRDKNRPSWMKENTQKIIKEISVSDV